MASSRFRRVYLASRLEAFSARIGEVPKDSKAEMAYAVGELTRNVLALFGPADDAHSRSPKRNLALAVKALRGKQPLVGDRCDETLDQLRVAVREMFVGLRVAARASK